MNYKPQPLITIAIPTFNRAAHLDRQLRWAVASANHCCDECEILVADNCSYDDTARLCTDWLRRANGKLRILRHAENIGAVANLKFCYEHATGKYVWSVGDDDVIADHALEYVVRQILDYSDLVYLHLNHRCVDGLRNNAVIHERFYPWETDQYEPRGANLYQRCLKHREGGLMFLTANIVYREAALEAISEWPDSDDNIAYPLYCSAFSAQQGAMFLTGDVFVDCVYNTGAWRGMGRKLRYVYTPQVYSLMARMGYDRKLLLRIVLRRLHSRSLLVMLLRHPDQLVTYFKYVGELLS